MQIKADNGAQCQLASKDAGSMTYLMPESIARAPNGFVVVEDMVKGFVVVQDMVKGSDTT